MSKYDKFFKLANEAGIQESELYISENTALSFSLFHNEIVQFSNNSSQYVLARGIVNGRFGSASSDVWNNQKCEYLVKEIKSNALVVENDDPAIIYAGSPQYKKVSTYSKKLESIDTNKKIEICKELEKKIRSLDKRIIEVESIGYSEIKEQVTIQNSKGLKLAQKSNYCVLYGSAVAKEGEQVKSDYSMYFDKSLDNLDLDKLAKEIVDKTVSQLGGEACPTASYKTVLAPNVVASLLKAYLGNAAAENVQKKASLFIGKLDDKVASSKLTVSELPLTKSVFARSFDDEGVATSNKAIIDKGILKTYIYTLSSAAKENRESTGNGYRRGARASEDFAYLSVKKGNKTQEELFEKVQNGVYITSVQGLHAGLNQMSGNFSLQSTGFLIKDGKLDRGLDIITLSGNLVDLFKSVELVGSDVKVFPSAVECPSLVIKSLKVSGK